MFTERKPESEPLPPRHWLDRVPYAAAWFWLGVVPFVVGAILWAVWP